MLVRKKYLFISNVRVKKYVYLDFAICQLFNLLES